jgi:hypothetical protein
MRTRTRAKLMGAALAAGVITTLAIAWLPALVLLPYAMISHEGHWRSWYEGHDNRTCLVRRSTIALSDWVQVHFYEHGVVVNSDSEAGTVPGWATRPTPVGAVSRVDTGATGWPVRALASEAWYFRDRPDELRHNLQLSSRATGRVFLPLRPLWPGLAADTAIFAGVWTLFVGTPWAIRRGVRRRRGRCPACGYDLRGQAAAGCPECGRGRAVPASPG